MINLTRDIKSYRKNYYLTHKSNFIEYGKDWLRKNKDTKKFKDYKKIKDALNFKKNVTPDLRKKYKLWTRYRMKPEDLLGLESKQNGACAICESVSKLNIDHCHKTGKVRGLLCSACNKGLGHFKDNLIVIKKAVKYLKQYKNE